MTRWLRLADELGLGLITWRPDEDGGWFCFASAAPEPYVARGATGADALAALCQRFAR